MIVLNVGLTRENNDFEENAVDEAPLAGNVHDGQQGLEFRRHFIETYFTN